MILTLSMQILSHASNHEDLHLFHNLSLLKFHGLLEPNWHGWPAVRLLLSRAPKLQMLVFQLTVISHFHSFTPYCGLKEPTDVPECLSSQLKTCHFKGFSGCEVEMELLSQILKEAKVLKTMKTTVESHLKSKEKLRIRKELRNFQRRFLTCQIAIDEGHFKFISLSLLIGKKQ